MTLGEMYAHIGLIVIINWAHSPRHRTTLILIMISNNIQLAALLQAANCSKNALFKNTDTHLRRAYHRRA